MNAEEPVKAHDIDDVPEAEAEQRTRNDPPSRTLAPKILTSPIKPVKPVRGDKVHQDVEQTICQDLVANGLKTFAWDQAQEMMPLKDLMQ